MVRLNQKSWFVKQKVLGANIHETEGLLERNIAIHLFTDTYIITHVYTYIYQAIHSWPCYF